ncbi:splicing factor 3B subunit 2-like isoform X2 [Ornithodoros turicata]|uniref:splicing factor 3B subunit 2-like isoform X2 n=1 Tax=Ornithodoros turicata TaxID=34597 RepID=UPI00313A00FB
MASSTASDLSKLRVVDLKERLSAMGLPTSGLKADLVKRLQLALEEEGLNKKQEEEMESAGEATENAEDSVVEIPSNVIEEAQEEPNEQIFHEDNVVEAEIHHLTTEGQLPVLEESPVTTVETDASATERHEMPEQQEVKQAAPVEEVPQQDTAVEMEQPVLPSVVEQEQAVYQDIITVPENFPSAAVDAVEVPAVTPVVIPDPAQIAMSAGLPHGSAVAPAVDFTADYSDMSQFSAQVIGEYGDMPQVMETGMMEVIPQVVPIGVPLEVPVVAIPPAEVHIPYALEEILATSERALEMGDTLTVVNDIVEEVPKVEPQPKKTTALVAIDEDEEEEMEVAKAVPEAKGKKKKKKKKTRAQRVQEQLQLQAEKEKNLQNSKKDRVEADIEYIQETIDSKDPYYYQFLLIFEKFKLQEPEKKGTGDGETLSEAALAQRLLERKKPADLDEKDDDDLGKMEEKPKLSKRKMKKLSRMSIADLKQKVNRPELVEMHDVTAKDPVLLLHLKSSRNTVPVPRHWCFKRKYLQGKRGIEKPPFDLPGFIKKTGIMEMRQALQEKEDQKTMKAKMREKVRPKLGKIDIDYQKLHDAFFKWQTKPRMTMHGDLYYEGKEFETRLKEKKPGDLSDDLRIALGMPTGPNSQKCPPPWLIAMQRYGPPPSYPNLKIPGLNAPIPDGCSFGYHAGGWGKPPVDEMGRPLYGDVFGTQSADGSNMLPEEEVDHTLWGELESESSEESEAEEESEEEEQAEDETGLVTPAEGLVTPSGFSSIPAGVETPEMIELRKRKIETEMEGGDTPSLYTVLPEKKAERVGAAMMGSTHIYDMSAALTKGAKVAGSVSERPGGVEIALDPSELEMDQAAMAARYEQTLREQQSHLAKEDLSDMVAEHAARQKNKRKKQQQDSGKTTKKYKEFKF